MRRYTTSDNRALVFRAAMYVCVPVTDAMHHTLFLNFKRLCQKNSGTALDVHCRELSFFAGERTHGNLAVETLLK